MSAVTFVMEVPFKCAERGDFSFEIHIPYSTQNRAGIDAKAALIQLSAPKGNCVRREARRMHCTFVQHSTLTIPLAGGRQAASTHEEAKPEKAKPTLAEELAEHIDARQELAAKYDDLMDKLAPSDAEHKSLSEMIRQTHRTVGDRIIYAFDKSAIAARAKYFERQMELGALHGKDRAERREVALQVKILTRLIDQITKQIERERAKRRGKTGNGIA